MSKKQQGFINRLRSVFVKKQQKQRVEATVTDTEVKNQKTARQTRREKAKKHVHFMLKQYHRIGGSRMSASQNP